jgi:hypothetical protein
MGQNCEFASRLEKEKKRNRALFTTWRPQVARQVIRHRALFKTRLATIGSPPSKKRNGAHFNTWPATIGIARQVKRNRAIFYNLATTGSPPSKKKLTPFLNLAATGSPPSN